MALRKRGGDEERQCGGERDDARDEHDWVFDIWGFLVKRCWERVVNHEDGGEGGEGEGKGEGGKEGRTLFTQSDLPEFVGPVLPHPPANTTRHQYGDDNSKEDTPRAGAVFLLEFLLESRTGVGNRDVEFLSALTGRDGNAAETSGFVPFLVRLVLRADEAMVRW